MRNLVPGKLAHLGLPGQAAAGTAFVFSIANAVAGGGAGLRTGVVFGSFLVHAAAFGCCGAPRPRRGAGPQASAVHHVPAMDIAPKLHGLAQESRSEAGRVPLDAPVAFSGWSMPLVVYQRKRRIGMEGK